MEANEVITLKITDLSFDAMGIGESEGKRVFVTNALPGEEVKARIIKVCTSYAIGRVEEIIKKSPDRNNGENDQWAQDGFANLANLKYDVQLKFKQNRIKKILKDNGLDNIEVKETVASPKPMAYRNERTVYVRNYKGQLEFGFLKPFTNEFEPITSYLTTNKDVENALMKMRDVLRKLKIPAYDPKTNTGFIRNVDVRRSESTGKIMVILVVSEKDSYDLPNIVGNTYAELPNLYGFSMNYNPHKTNKIWGKRDIPLWGENYLIDKINGLTFRFSPQSYFQFNSVQAPRVREIAIKEAGLKPSDVVIDAYAGVGTISLLLAKSVKEVRGIEKIAASVADAKANAKLNKIDNVKYYKGDVDVLLARWQKAGFKADVVFVDPPHKGLSRGFINSLAKMGVKKLVYISTNPETLVRDIIRLKKYGYSTDQITPIDLSPQKSEIKSVTVLKLN